MTIKYSKSEVKSIIKVKMKDEWQAHWDRDGKGRYYYTENSRVEEAAAETRMESGESELVTQA